ncbi:hypothetical protein [Geodermatophilus sp. DSM 45219]|uniref:hypothetical protein n=1 Tax=Geodermatophilus sp. DSM 45219 TaxID=1881103 RepID=UPI0008892866|nr:hypothetical protein [Geodermatophilus sp. DSM 45219]SDO37703.1 hypothetical protein SAMN05428965_3803 [Geodermatophilus sp. DSM 45219]
MTSATGTHVNRQLLRWSGALLLGGLVLTTAVTMLFHPSGDEDVHESIFAQYAASDSWEWVHFAQFVGVLLALGGLIVLHRVLRARTPTLSAVAAGLTVATAAVWAGLQAIDGITLKQAVDAWAVADGFDEAVRSADAEIVRWTEWGAQSYFRVLLGATMLLFGVAILVTRLLAGWTGWVAMVAAILSLGIGVDVGYSGLDSGFQQIASPAFQVLMLAFAVGVIVAAARGRVSTSAHD